MRTLKILSLILFVGLAFTACKSDDDGGDGGSADVGTMTATVAGNSFSGNIVAIANQISAGGNTSVTLQGSDDQGRAIIIIINAFDGTGTYEISVDNTIAITASYTEADVSNPVNSQSWQAPYAGGGVSGEVNVSEVTDTTIKGTFNFTGKNASDDSTKNITNGQFNLAFQ